jgi:hypothetical protein
MSEVKEDWKIEGTNHPKWYREGEITFNREILTLDELRWVVRMKISFILDGTLLKDANANLAIPKRWERKWDFLVKNRIIAYKWPNSSSYKDIGVLDPHESDDDFENTLPRELVIRLKWMDDNFTTEFFSITRLASIVMRCANDPKKRQFIAENRTRVEKLEHQINTKQKEMQHIYHQDTIPTPSQKHSLLSIEREAEDFYNECKDMFGLQPIDGAVISVLSWDWKNPYTRRGLQYSCWCWVIITCIFGLIKKL